MKIPEKLKMLATDSEDIKNAKKKKVLRERDSFIDNLLVQIHFIILMILVDRPCAMGV